MSIRDNRLVTGSADHGLRCYNLYEMSIVVKIIDELWARAVFKAIWTSWVGDISIIASKWSYHIRWYGFGPVLLGCEGCTVRYIDGSSGISDEGGHWWSIHCHIGELWCDHDNLVKTTQPKDRNLGTMEEARKLFGPHRDAILDFDWKNSLAVSGDKSGVVAFWDINEGVAVFNKKVSLWEMFKLHTGACG